MIPPKNKDLIGVKINTIAAVDFYKISYSNIFLLFIFYLLNFCKFDSVYLIFIFVIVRDKFHKLSNKQKAKHNYYLFTVLHTVRKH